MIETADQRRTWKSLASEETMQDATHTPDKAAHQPAIRARRHLCELESADAEWPDIRAARRAYFAALHTATEDDSVPDCYGSGFMRAVTAAKKEHDAALARLAVIEADPDNYTQADYVDAAVAETQAEDRHSLISLQWEGHMAWQREQRLQSERPRVKRTRYKPKTATRAGIKYPVKEVSQ